MTTHAENGKGIDRSREGVTPTLVGAASGEKSPISARLWPRVHTSYEMGG